MQKNLAYFLQHPDEMPTDPAEIERLASEQQEAALESGTELLTVDRIVGKDETAPVQAEEKAEPTEPKAEETPDAKPDGILAKDGKNVIPYAQLEMARQQAAEAKARADEAERLARTQADEIAALKSGKVEPADAGVLSDEELQALEADSPTLAKVIRAQQENIRSMREEVTELRQGQQSVVADQAATVKSEIQSAIDANPTLASWQAAEDQAMWDKASRYDKMLREAPEYANTSFADRFTKVVTLVQAETGNLPKQETQAPDQDAIRRAAEARLQQATAGKKPITLSDIPGGAPPVVDERAKVENASITALGQQFMGMSRDQLDAYLATL